MTPRELEALGAQIILGNTYHLHFRPGAERDRRARRPAPLHGLGRARSSPIPAASRSSRSPRRAASTTTASRSARSTTAPRRASRPSSRWRSRRRSAPTSPWRSTSARRRARRAPISSARSSAPSRWAERCVAAPRPDGPAALRHRARAASTASCGARSVGQLTGAAVRRLRDRRAQRGRGARGDVRRDGRRPPLCCRPSGRATSWASATPRASCA